MGDCSKSWQAHTAHAMEFNRKHTSLSLRRAGGCDVPAADHKTTVTSASECTCEKSRAALGGDRVCSPEEQSANFRRAVRMFHGHVERNAPKGRLLLLAQR